jgi:hypothetical protein
MKTYKRNLATRLINWWFRTLTKLGLGASYRQILTVRGRKTGRTHSGGDRWLVAGYGPANWVGAQHPRARAGHAPPRWPLHVGAPEAIDGTPILDLKIAMREAPDA